MQESVSTLSKQAIGQKIRTANALEPEVGDQADFVILLQNQTLHSAALEPGFDRITIKSGRVVSRRKASRWILGEE